MNKTNQKELATLIGTLEEAVAAIQAIHDDEREAFDDKSEKWQESEKGEEASEALDTIQAQVDALEEIVGELSGMLDR
jgi:flagellar biosynthesis chaperone FliJ